MSYFDDENKEYIIDELKPRRPLKNYIWSEKVVCYIDHFGNGCSTACIDTIMREIAGGSKHMFIKREDGEIYSANRNFADLPFDMHQTHVGLGYHRIISLYKGLQVEMTFCIPPDGYLELNNIELTNRTNKKISFDGYFYACPFVNTTEHTSYSRGEYRSQINGLLYSHNAYSPKHDYNTVLVKADTPIHSAALKNSDFIGVYGNISHPDAISQPQLSNMGATFENNYCAAMHFKFALDAGESKSVNVAIALGKNETEVLEYTDRYCNQAAYEETLEYNRDLHEDYQEIFCVNSPDKVFNSSVNLWLKRQVSLGKTWGRVYRKGFRDVMQDIAAFVSFDPELAKKRILHALKHQFINGNTIRMFEPDYLAPYTDGAAWIPATILAYVNETGDITILDEIVGYYDGDDKDSVYEHMERGLKYLTTSLGQHGLVLWGGGDWNDSLNNCGNNGIGESVWLSIATVKAINEYSQIAKIANKDNTKFEASAKELTDKIFKHGFESDRFIYGFNDYGEKIGSIDSDQAQLYLNPQTWAIISGIAKGEIANIIKNKVESDLKCAYGYKQCVPPYSRGTDKIGRASYFVEGLVENGSVYLHGVMFKIVSDCISGDGDNAYNTYLMTRYDNPNNPNNGMEPYAVSNMFIGDDCPYSSQRGYAPMSWVTGSAGWLYRGLTEYLLGIKASFDGLLIEPCIPSSWNEVSLDRTFRGAKYSITIKKGEKALFIDGKKIAGNFVPYDGKDHKVLCIV